MTDLDTTIAPTKEELASQVIQLIRTGAMLCKSNSKQDYATPREFLDHVEKRFGAIEWDLAAHAGNAVIEEYYGPDSAHGENSLAEDWGKLRGVLWLNPPFGNIETWAHKCAQQQDRKGWLLMLVPASVGANWYRDFVRGKCFELFLNQRIPFVGMDQGFPKDLVLCCYGYGVSGSGDWSWKEPKERTLRAPKTPKPSKVKKDGTPRATRKKNSIAVEAPATESP